MIWRCQSLQREINGRLNLGTGTEKKIEVVENKLVENSTKNNRCIKDQYVECKRNHSSQRKKGQIRKNSAEMRKNMDIDNIEELKEKFADFKQMFSEDRIDEATALIKKNSLRV